MVYCSVKRLTSVILFQGLTSIILLAQIESQFRIGRLKYSGGSDWYNDPSAEINLLSYARVHAGIDAVPTYEFVELSSEKLFTYPMLFMTGHGNIVFSETEVQRLREYLTRGGFLYVDDDYGLDKAFRREIQKVFPNTPLVELPFSHPLYHCWFEFPSGVPKIHAHDDNPPQGFGIFYEGRLVVFYTFESNPSDGWADPEIHHDPPEVREKALQFGTNILVWVMTH
ncbi:MAG: DUF4159 domain-containing protein [Bacteroidetes bacterium]|nr:DUF4159 domain-containing protein [Bacteroidota bacterium]